MISMIPVTLLTSQSACAALDAEKLVGMFVQSFKDLLSREQEIILYSVI